MTVLDHDTCRVAGRLLAGERSLADLDEMRQIEVFDFLVKGKLVLFGNASSGPAAPSRLLFDGLDTPALAARIARERTRCDAQRSAFLAAQAHLERSRIPLLLFKSTGPYPYTSSNVDALVPAGELDRAARLLEEAGHHEMVHYWEPNKRLLREFDGSACRLMVHLHTKISWIVLAFADVDALWRGARRSIDPAVLHPAPEHLVALLLAHSVYESNKVHVGDVWKVREAARSAGFDWDEVLRIARVRSWLPGLAFSLAWYTAAEQRLFGESALAAVPLTRAIPSPSEPQCTQIRASVSRAFPARLGKRVTKPFYFRKLLVDNPRSLAQKMHDLAGVAEQLAFGRLGLRTRPGALVCFCGIDGSGKSTHADALRAVLAECEIPSRRVWMRGGYSPVVTWIKARLRGSSVAVPGVGDVQGKLRVYRQPWTRWLWGWLVAVEQIVQAVFTVRVQRWMGRTLVAERYVPDTLADLAERFDEDAFAATLSARVMRRLCPRPDAVVFLDVPGEVAFERKPDDWSAEVLEARRRRYQSALAAMPQVSVLDAQLPLEDVSKQAITIGLQTVLGRIRTSNPLGRRRRDGWE